MRPIQGISIYARNQPLYVRTSTENYRYHPVCIIVYKHPAMPPPSFLPEILKDLLLKPRLGTYMVISTYKMMVLVWEAA